MLQCYVSEIEHLENPELKEFIRDKNNLTFACLDEVTDPRNIGSLIRSAASFDIDGLIVKERHFPSESKLMYKSASGSIEYLNDSASIQSIQVLNFDPEVAVNFSNGNLQFIFGNPTSPTLDALFDTKFFEAYNDAFDGYFFLKRSFVFLDINLQP